MLNRSGLSSARTRLTRRLAIALLLAAAASTCSLAPSPVATSGEVNSAKADAPAAEAIDFTLKDLNGKPMRLSGLRGHPVIVDFWATWCPPCRRQIPELEAIYRRYQSQGLVVIGVACDTVKGEGMRAIAPFVKELHVNYPILLADDAVVDRLDLDAIPTTLFVGRDGNLVGRVRGAGRRGELAGGAKELMAY